MQNNRLTYAVVLNLWPASWCLNFLNYLQIISAPNQRVCRKRLAVGFCQTRLLFAALTNSNINSAECLCLVLCDVREVDSQTLRSFSGSSFVCRTTCDATRNTRDTVVGGPRRRDVLLNIQVLRSTNIQYRCVDRQFARRRVTPEQDKVQRPAGGPGVFSQHERRF